MANLTLELIINSANNLKDVNLITKMDVYAVATIYGDDTQKNQKMKTAIDHSGGPNPTWNHGVKFSVNERLARDGRLTLVIILISRRHVLGDKDIGGVNIPLLELLDSITPSTNGDGNGKEMTFVTYQVKSPSGKRKGNLTFSYRFNTPPIRPDSPAIAHPPPPSRLGYSSASPLSQIERSPSARLEPLVEYPQLSQPPHQKYSDHQKLPDSAGSRFDPLPISYGAGSLPYQKPGYAYHHAPPQQSCYANFAPSAPNHHGYGQNVYAPPSPAGYGHGYPSPQQPRGLGLGLDWGLGFWVG
ncbi:unnamed protein product [Thlaspi arvense]|uniref:C2 domain-containing protein n=1 Tax=Thlaspi arvense TaxID=13288 RepID=A0AAU9T4Q9_THLAR|nr:unnamed protein product [Thlaspi arvense]